MKAILDRAERFWRISQSALGPMRIAQKRLQARGADVLDFTSLNINLAETKSFRSKLREIDSAEFIKPASVEQLFKLKEDILRIYPQFKSAALDPEKDIAIIPGVKIGASFMTLSLLNPGDVAAIPDPGHSLFRSAVCLAEGEPTTYTLNETSDYVANISGLTLPPPRKLKMLFLNYPHNPTGAMVDFYFYRDLLKAIKLEDVLIVSDCSFNHPGDNNAVSPLQVAGAKKKTVELHSFSTSFGIKGLGFAIGHRDAIAVLNDVLSSIGFSVDSGRIAIASLALADAEEIFNDSMDILKHKREILENGLRDLGWNLRAGKLTPYLWIKAPIWSSSLAFTRRLFIKAGIRVVSGTDYGEHGEGWIRMSLLHENEILHEALERISHHSKIWQRKIRSK